MGGPGTPGNAAARPRDTRARLLRGALHSLLLAAVALFFLNFNLVGTASPSRRFSQDLVYAWFGDQAWLYPREDTAVAGRAATQPRVVVVILDERALALRGARWPVSVQFHAQFLAELEVLRPRAILLDFLLIDPAPRADICELLNVASRLRADGIALYLAVTRADDLAPMDAVDCPDAGGKAIRASQVFTAVSVERQADDSDFVSRRYPFEQRSGDTAAGSGMPSAAVRMYCDTYAQPGQLPRAPHRRPGGRRGITSSRGRHKGDSFNQHWSHASCVESLSPMRAVLNKPALPRESACPPVATLFATALLSPVEDPTLGTTNEQLFDLADGAFLMVGGNFRGSGDLVTTPLHTLLPGVYYHAAALQNLFAFDGHPKVRKEFRTPRTRLLPLRPAGAVGTGGDLPVAPAGAA